MARWPGTRASPRAWSTIGPSICPSLPSSTTRRGGSSGAAALGSALSLSRASPIDRRTDRVARRRRSSATRRAALWVRARGASPSSEKFASGTAIIGRLATRVPAPRRSEGGLPSASTEQASTEQASANYAHASNRMRCQLTLAGSGGPPRHYLQGYRRLRARTPHASALRIAQPKVTLPVRCALLRARLCGSTPYSSRPGRHGLAATGAMANAKRGGRLGISAARPAVGGRRGVRAMREPHGPAR